MKLRNTNAFQVVLGIISSACLYVQNKTQWGSAEKETST